MRTRRSREQLFYQQNFIDPDGDPSGALTSRRELSAESSCELRLMLAVVEDAVSCYQRYCLATSRKKRRLFLEAETYIFAKGDLWPYSFVNCCRELRFEPEYLKRGLRTWKEQRLANTVAAPPKIRRRVRSAVIAQETRIKPTQPRKRYKKKRTDVTLAKQE